MELWSRGPLTLPALDRVVRYYEDCPLPLRSELVNHHAKDILQRIRVSPSSEW